MILRGCAEVCLSIFNLGKSRRALALNSPQQALRDFERVLHRVLETWLVLGAALVLDNLNQAILDFERVR